MDKQLSPIYFMGIADKYYQPVIGHGRTSNGEEVPVSRHDIIGLRNHYLSSIYPFACNQLWFFFLVDFPWFASLDNSREVSLTIENDKKVIDQIKISIDEIQYDNKDGQKYMLEGMKFPGIIQNPGNYKFYYLENDKKIPIGNLYLQYIPALPLTEERIKAIESDPFAFKWVQTSIKCNKCGKELKTFAGLKKVDNKLNKDAIWYKELPEHFKCECGSLDLDLKYIKESLHSVLGGKKREPVQSITGEKYYDEAALKDIIQKFSILIKKEKAKEEDIQKFIEENSVLLNCFSPQLIKFKGEIGSQYKTDFVVLNQKNELVLIEIEKTDMKLFKKDGCQTANLTHALDQIKNWLVYANRNRLSVIDNLKIEELDINKITNIRGVLIAGRRGDGKAENIEKIVTTDRIDFYTYDDFLDNLITTYRSLKSL